MDCMIVVRDDRAVCTPLHHVVAGDPVVLGQRGVRVIPPERPRTRSLFEFMGGAVSSERPSATLIHKIAEEMVNAKAQGKKIAVLAGSIRDDGPLPEVITDIMAAQDAMREILQGVDLVLMMATMLHSIAVGNMLPSYVKTICVDINPATVTKLIDRGTAQAIGVVTDVGTLLPALASELEMIDGE